MWFSPDGCTRWHFIKHHFSAKLHSISGASNILFISSRGAGSKVRTEQVPSLRKQSRWPIFDGLSSLDEKLLQSQADQCQLIEVLAEGYVLSCDTESFYPFSKILTTIQFYHWPLQKWRSPLWPMLWNIHWY